jgi:hypothetical protein
MDAQVIKVLAKYNALFYAATVLDNHAKAFDLHDDDFDLPDEFYEQLGVELQKIVNSLHNRAKNLTKQYQTPIPNLVEILLADS